MTVLSAQSIQERGIITPFHQRTIHRGMSFGLSSCGYDVRIAQTQTLFPGEFGIFSTMEHLQMPDDLMAKVCDKSTWARRGVCVQNTIIEPGWHGHLTLEIFNMSRSHQWFEKGMPIAQIIFELLDKPTAQPYAGKYQNQPDHPVAAILE